MTYSACFSDEIEKAVYAIVSVMPAPRGMDGAKLIQGYITALKGFSLPAIQAAVEGFLNGRFASEFSTKFCPTPPDLAAMVRKINESGAARPREELGRRKYAYNAPNSVCAERNIRREDGRRLVDQGMYPEGCIWIPGTDDKPEFGELYYPDPEWRTPVLIRTPDEVKADEAEKPKDIGMTDVEKRAAIDHLGAVFRTTAPRERAGFWARDHSDTIRRFIEDYRHQTTIRGAA